MKFLSFLNLIESKILINKNELEQWLDIIEKEVPQEYFDFFDDCDPHSHKMSYDERRRLASSSCPYLGLEEVEGEWLDGIDDLADIVGDLQEVKWCIKNTSLDDARWYYRHNYHSHFAEHIQSIRKILKLAKPVN
jgi:hypothetical protein